MTVRLHLAALFDTLHHMVEQWAHIGIKHGLIGLRFAFFVARFAEQVTLEW